MNNGIKTRFFWFFIALGLILGACGKDEPPLAEASTSGNTTTAEGGAVEPVSEASSEVDIEAIAARVAEINGENLSEDDIRQIVETILEEDYSDVLTLTDFNRARDEILEEVDKKIARAVTDHVEEEEDHTAHDAAQAAGDVDARSLSDEQQTETVVTVAPTTTSTPKVVRSDDSCNVEILSLGGVRYRASATGLTEDASLYEWAIWADYDPDLSGVDGVGHYADLNNTEYSEGREIRFGVRRVNGSADAFICKAEFLMPLLPVATTTVAPVTTVTPTTTAAPAVTSTTTVQATTVAPTTAAPATTEAAKPQCSAAISFSVQNDAGIMISMAGGGADTRWDLHLPGFGTQRQADRGQSILWYPTEQSWLGLTVTLSSPDCVGTKPHVINKIA